jgi:oligopeptide transport system substrate-binding protein
MKKIALLAIAAAAIFLFLFSKKPPTEQKSLRLAFLTEADSLDPRIGYEIPANHLVKMLFEGLFRMTPQGKLAPALAESHTISPDGKTYTFKLRPAKWTNGDSVTAHDFEYTWKWIVNPKSAARGTGDFFPVKNAQKVIAGELPLDSFGVRALDDRTLVVELEQPTPYFLELTTTSVYLPIPSRVDRSDPEWNHKIPLIANGPFALKSRTVNERIALEKNPTYWNASQIKIDAIDISIVGDSLTQLSMFERGELDWFGKPFATLPLDAVASLREKNALELFPEQALYWYYFNTEKFPFDNPKLRKAFALAIHRQPIVDHVLKESETIATSLSRQTSFFADGDLDAARRLFKEALAELNLTPEQLPKISIAFCKLETNTLVANIVKEQWENAFNIPIHLDGQEWVAYYDNLVNGNYQIGGLSWHSRIRDPIYNLSVFKHKSDRLNISNWEDPAYQALLDSAQAAADPAQRLDLLRQAEAFLLDQMPIAPVYFRTVSYCKSPSLSNVYVSEINEIDFTWAEKTNPR